MSFVQLFKILCKFCSKRKNCLHNYCVIFVQNCSIGNPNFKVYTTKKLDQGMEKNDVTNADPEIRIKKQDPGSIFIYFIQDNAQR